MDFSHQFAQSFPDPMLIYSLDGAIPVCITGLVRVMSDPKMREFGKAFIDIVFFMSLKFSKFLLPAETEKTP